MDAKTLINCLKVFPAQQAILIRGDHGVGKSQIVKALAQLTKKTLIDVRASTMQEGDVVGYPDLEAIKSTGRTTFALPSWFMQACEEPCILFLDELNRGLIGVQNGFFQVVLDRELGNGPDGRPRRLHPETQVIAAVNVGNDYTVSEMDPALLDRFWVTDLKPTVVDWIDWATMAGIDDLIIDFIRQHPEHLRPTKAVEPGKVAPTGRSWAALNTVLKHNGLDLSQLGGKCPAILYPISIGFIGVEAAAALKDFVDNYASVITAEDILDCWDQVKDNVTKLTIEKNLAIIEKVKNHCGNNKWTLNQVGNLKEFFDSLTGEGKMALYNSIMSAGNTKNLHSFHKLVKDEVMSLVQQAQAVASKDASKRK